MENGIGGEGIEGVVDLEKESIEMNRFIRPAVGEIRQQREIGI